MDGGFTAAVELFSNRTCIWLAALTLAQAMIMPLGNAAEGEMVTTAPTVAPVNAKVTVVPVLAGILAGSIPIPPLTIPPQAAPL